MMLLPLKHSLLSSFCFKDSRKLTLKHVTPPWLHGETRDAGRRGIKTSTPPLQPNKYFTQKNTGENKLPLISTEHHKAAVQRENLIFEK